MKTIGIISLSNGLDIENKALIDTMKKELMNNDIKIIESNCIYKENKITLPPKLRANELMKLYKNPNIDMIFDVSGGDLANEVLRYIDFNIIKNNKKTFFGFSDLSVIMNSIYKKTHIESCWFQLRNIVRDKSKTSLKLFLDYLLTEDNSIFNFNYEFLQGKSMSGTVVGGNLRCSLKLAGTEFMPEFKDNLLFIESLGGDINKITTYLTQYKLMGAFEKTNGVILGTFTELENQLSKDDVIKLILNIIDNDTLPVIKTDEIGHSSLSKSIIIGKNYTFKKSVD